MQSFKLIGIKLYEELLTKVPSICHQMPKSKRGITLQRKKKKKILILLFFMLLLYIKFQDYSSDHSSLYASVMKDRQMDRQRDRQAQTHMPQQSWGHKYFITYLCFYQLHYTEHIKINNLYKFTNLSFRSPIINKDFTSFFHLNFLLNGFRL